MFSASTNAGSAKHTSRLLGPLLRWLFPDMPGDARMFVVFCIRKAAHVTEYAILALLLWRALRSRNRAAAGGWNRRHAFAVVALGATFAVTDEFSQTFWSERLGSPRDVALDTFGAALGISLLWLVGRWRRKW